MAHSNDEIRGVLLQAGEERVLLPNATVAEVLARVPVEPIADAPAWLPGQILWHGWQVPLVSFTRLAGIQIDVTRVRLEVADEVDEETHDRREQRAR